MQIDRSQEPTTVRLQGAIHVTLHLKGDEGYEWTLDYTEPAEQSGLDASAVPRAGVTIKDVDKVEETLRAAVELLDAANRLFRAELVGAADGGQGEGMVEGVLREIPTALSRA